MADYVPAKALAKVENIAERYKAQIEKAKDKAKEATKVGIRTGAAMGTAFGVAYWEGKVSAAGTPEKSQVFGMDVSLLVGVAGLATDALGLAGDEQTNDIAGAIGLGALCAFAAKKGASKGQEAAKAA